MIGLNYQPYHKGTTAVSDYRFSLVETDEDYLASFDVMRELRPHLAGAAAFAAQARRQREQGYRLLAAWKAGQVMGLAGYRVQENLLYGRFVYVDDLVISTGGRRHGLGAELIEAVREEARRQDCAHLVLDTALSNALGQRFYFRQGLLARGLHFSQQL